MKFMIRNILKNKVSSFINILGLSIGLASAIIIFLFIEYELSFDNFYKDKDEIYRITAISNHASGVDTDGATTYPLGYSLRNDFPDYLISTLYMMSELDVVIDKDVYKEKNILFVDSVFFNIFSSDWIIGSPEILKSNPGNIILTKSISQKYFGNENPLGKTLTFSNDQHFQVAGLIQDAPLNSTLNYSMIASTEILDTKMVGFNYDSWENSISGFETYMKIPKSVEPLVIEKQINDIIKSNYATGDNKATNTYYQFQALNQIHLSPEFEDIPNTYTTSKASLWIYGFIGILILCIASINYINLSTAQGLKRSKEVGIRKVLGSSRSQLSMLFVKENSVVLLLSLVFSVIVVEIVLPYVNNFMGNNLNLSIYQSRYFVIFLFLVYLLVDVMIALYPSLVMSGFMPIKALKGNLRTNKNKGFNLRNSLLVFQFIISITLIISTLVIKKQINYINNKDLGFEVKGIFNFLLPDSDENKIKSMKDYLLTQPGIVNFTFGIGAPSSTSNFRTSFKVEGDEAKHYMNLKLADAEYYKTFELKLIAGNWYHERIKGDTIFRMVVSEKLYKTHGFKSPEEALNKRIPFGGNEAIICGVVKDFHIYSLRNEIESIAFLSIPQYYLGMFIKIDQNRTKETIAGVEKKLKELYPANAIEYESMSESLKEMYTEDNKISMIIMVLSMLAIVIASLGLFGLVSFMMVQRIKEIGIRKVLGASVTQIAMVLTKTYFKLIIIAGLIAVPLGWYFMNRWLNGFSYRIEIGIWVYLIAILLVISVAMITILFQIIKTGRMNPVTALKYE